MRVDNINCSNNQYHLTNSSKVNPVFAVSKGRKYKDNNASNDNEEKGFQKKLKQEQNKR